MWIEAENTKLDEVMVDFLYELKDYDKDLEIGFMNAAGRLIICACR